MDHNGDSIENPPFSADGSRGPGRNIFVLSGGGSRGAGQVGMLRALLGAGVAPDVLIGGSVGAINAAFMGADPSADQVERLADRWMTMTSTTLTGERRSALANLARRRAFLFTSDRMRKVLNAWLPAERLEDLKVPVRVATTCLTTGRAVHHDRGNLTDLICASTALPAVFPPVVMDGDDGPVTHVDAGIAENLPMSGAYAIARPGDRIYALDVTKTPLPRLLRNPLDVLIAALVATVRNQSFGTPPPGVEVVHLKLDESFDCGPVFDFSHTGTLFRLGEQCATAALVASLPAAA
ncbi:patatin-like phospholipase family protein [Nocardioides sp.]|uniref:patatin-like phospholipase family protein n=1 Tax=Nocardioides sp. TaxID=35761 RepID=UPI0035677D43